MKAGSQYLTAGCPGSDVYDVPAEPHATGDRFWRTGGRDSSRVVALGSGSYAGLEPARLTRS